MSYPKRTAPGVRPVRGERPLVPGFRDKTVRKAPRREDPSRNLATPRGVPVTAADVRPYAKQSCARCRGRGYTLKDLVCRYCAQPGFLKAHPEVVIDERGMAWWPAKGGPEDVSAEARAKLVDPEAAP